MSPEQCRGTGEITGKSDVYSLGVMLYEMTSGRPPLEGQASGELIAMHLYMVPTSLSQVDPSLPTEFTQLVDAMLAKNPDDRPAMTEVTKQLEQLGAGRSIPPLPGAVAALTSAMGAGDKAPTGSPSWPDVVAGMLATPNTLRAAPAKAPPAPPVARRSLNPYLLVTIAAVGVAVVVSLQLARRPAGQPVASAPPATTGQAAEGAKAAAQGPAAKGATVHWRITSRPTGAQVVRVSDQQILGTTPWQSELSAGPATVALILRLRGFADKNLELRQSADVDRSEELEQAAAAPSAEPRSRGKRRAAARTPSTGTSASKEISDDELRIVQ
jgi:hypothetical protein